jgi:hypothetical protein
MKRILFTLLFLVAFLAGYSQMSNNGGTITVENGATLVIEGSYTSTGAGVIEIDGNVQLKGNFVNNGGNIHSGSTGTLTLNGTSAQQIGGTTPTDFYCAVVVNNAGGVSLSGADEVLYNALTLTNGKFTLNAYDLTMAAAGITATSSNYVVTSNPAGELKAAVGSSDVTFPVGDASTYNPVKLNNTGGTSDTYGVVFTGGSTPAGATHAVNGYWAVSEGVAGGSNLAVTPQWAGTQELASFDRNDCAVGVNNGSTTEWKASGSAVGGDPYTQTGSGFTSVGSFVVGDYYYEGIELALNLWLAGAYSGGTMSTAINGIIPPGDPYGNGAVAATIPATAVDWIEVELRDKTNHATTLFSRSFFVDLNGNVLNVDGVTGAKLTGIPKDQYYVAILHRNHLGVVSSSTVNLSGVSPAYNFTTAQAQAWQDDLVANNAALKEVATGVFGLWEGDANGDGIVDYFGAGTDKASIVTQLGATTLGIPVNGYFGNDVNMDGVVDYFGAGTDKSTIVAVLGATTLGLPKESHLP